MAADQRQQATVEVAEAELEVHNAIVEEYVQDLSTLAQDVRGLQQAPGWRIPIVDHGFGRTGTARGVVDARRWPISPSTPRPCLHRSAPAL